VSVKKSQELHYSAGCRRSHTHDKKHLSAKKIRARHNVTLSMEPMITAAPSTDIKLDD